MKRSLRLAGLDLLRGIVNIVVVGLSIVIGWYTIPAFLDYQSGRVPLSEVSGRFLLGGAAFVAMLGLAIVIRHLNTILAFEREATRAERRAAARLPTPAPITPTSTLAANTQLSAASPFRRPAAASPFTPTRPTAYPAYWPELRQLVLERDHFQCGNCGSSENLHVHHIVPLSLGGTNELGNLRTLCKSCHERLHPHMRGN